MQFKRLLILASLVITSYAQTSVAQKVEDDINNKIAPALDILLSSIDAFPISNGTVIQALTIHTNAIDLNTTLVDTTNDMNVEACEFITSDAQTILCDLKALLPKIQQSLTDIVARKAAFQALPLGDIPGVIKDDLNLLSQDTETLASSFTNCAPEIDVEQPDVLPGIKDLFSEVKDAFGPAIAAFA
ncbi:hypothetical protein C0993_009914 [Termitomyces sp. T159_Od127]|nr:hypothetical protein C0993_009914 [Termitomyces sp. T159_Od127]